MFGYQEAPTVSEVSVYFLYLIPALFLFFMPQGKQPVAVSAPAGQKTSR